MPAVGAATATGTQVMDSTAVAIVFAGYLTAGVVKGTTGLGFSSTCLPILALAIGLKDALPLVILPSVCSNILVMIDAGGFLAALRRFWPVYLASLPGLAVGLWGLDRMDGAGAAAVLGIVMIGYTLYALARPAMRLPPRVERPLTAPAGFLTGVINGLTGSQVMPILPYMMALGLAPGLFIQAINISFTLSSGVMAAGLTGLGLFTVMALWMSGLGLIPMVAGIWIGGRVRRWLKPDAFRRVILLCLLALGIMLIVRPLLD